MLPEGAQRIQHRQRSRFSEYALNHAQTWFTYANGPGLARGTQGLYFVTGCDKARAWGVASFYDADPERVWLQFEPQWPSNNEVLPIYHFTKSESASSSSGADSMGEQSGCVFLRGYKVTIRAPGLPSKLGAEVENILQLDANELLPQWTNNSSILLGLWQLLQSYIARGSSPSSKEQEPRNRSERNIVEYEVCHHYL